MPPEALTLLGQTTIVTSTVFLAGLCLFASAHKFSNLPRFKKVVEDYQILPQAMIGVVAGGLPLFELFIGVAILVPASSSLAALMISGLFALYGVAMLSTILRGKALQDCGCGGPAHTHGQAQVLGAWHIIRNALLVLMALGVASNAVVSIHTIEAQAWLLVVPASAFLALLYWAADTLIANHGLMSANKHRLN